MNKVELRERRLAYTVQIALNEPAGQLPPDVRDRLVATRRMALAQKETEAPSTVHSLVLTMSGGGSISFEMEGEVPSPSQRAAVVLRHLGLPWPTIVLVAGLAGICQWQQQQRVDGPVEVNAAMPLDDLPLAVYADQGFHQYFKHDQWKVDR